jgi:predicted metal-dependent hydrolase
MLFDQFLSRTNQPASVVDMILVGARAVPLLSVRNPRARRYLLRVRSDGTARVTIPRRGTFAAGREFAQRHTVWLERQLTRLAAQPRTPAAWPVGADIWSRGDRVRIEASEPGRIRFGSESLHVADPSGDLRPVIELHLRRLAAQELPPRVQNLAAQQGLTVRRISVRNQKTRWGSCSRRGTISLNWRLIQTPPFVQEYICLHEIFHLREMNHSARYWQAVERACPDYRQAERWLKEYATLLR